MKEHTFLHLLMPKHWTGTFFPGKSDFVDFTTHLLVPSGNLPLNSRANFYFEVKIPDWWYNLYPQFNCKIAPKRPQLFPLLKYMFCLTPFK